MGIAFYFNTWSIKWFWGINIIFISDEAEKDQYAKQYKHSNLSFFIPHEDSIALNLGTKNPPVGWKFCY